MQKAIKYLGYLDYAVAAGTLIYGLLFGSTWLVAGGALGLVLAWYSPAKRIQALLATRFLGRRKRAYASEQASAALEAVRLAEEETAVERSSLPLSPLDYRGNNFGGYGPVRVGASRHNVLTPSSTNLVGDSRAVTFS